MAFVCLFCDHVVGREGPCTNLIFYEPGDEKVPVMVKVRAVKSPVSHLKHQRSSTGIMRDLKQVYWVQPPLVAGRFVLNNV